MNFDKRINSINDIQTVINSSKEIIGKKGYLAKTIRDFKDLSRCDHGTVDKYREDDECFCHKIKYTSGITDYTWYSYFIPEEDLKPEEPKKKYKPYTDKEFLTLFDLGKFHSIRITDEPYTRVVITSIYRSTDGILYINVNGNDESGYGVSWLFKHCEYFNGEEWKPFGVVE